jgi:DNA repair protein RadD
MPTGSGKSPLIAKVASDAVEKWGGRVLCLAHRKELLQQNAEKLHFFAPTLKYGIYSAGLKKRDTKNDVIFAGIQSAYLKAEDLGHFDLVIVDEAHLIPPDGEGMYQTFLTVAKAINPHLRVIGLTATPFRMKTGTICTDVGILNNICFEAPIVPLVNQGFLTRLVARGGNEKAEINTEGIKVVGGEFALGELEIIANTKILVEAAVKDVMKLTKERKKVLIFATGVAHAHAIESEILHYTSSVQSIIGTTKNDVRDARLTHFRENRIKFMINVGVFTEGLDVPDIDCIVLLRPTRSTGLYVQMVGRGLRVSEGKKDCLILDYGKNVLRHGPIDEIRIDRAMRGRSNESGEVVAKKCPECEYLVAAGYATCPHCGFEFPPPEPEHTTVASKLQLMDRTPDVRWEKVEAISYEPWRKSGAPPTAPRTFRVNYRISFTMSISEWVCVEHDEGSFARSNAMKWWFKRSDQPFPRNVDDAVYRSEHLRKPGRIKVRYGRGRHEFDRIVDYEFPLNNGELLSDINANLKQPEEDVELPF